MNPIVSCMTVQPNSACPLMRVPIRVVEAMSLRSSRRRNHYAYGGTSEASESVTHEPLDLDRPARLDAPKRACEHLPKIGGPLGTGEGWTQSPRMAPGDVAERGAREGPPIAAFPFPPRRGLRPAYLVPRGSPPSHS